MNDSDNNIDNIKDDYEFTRETLRDLVGKGSEAFEDMIAVAKESEHPRAYEVLSGMMKNIADISEKLMDINMKNKAINTNVKPKELPGSTTNNVFIGTTSDLQKLLNQQHQDTDEVIDV